MMKLTLLTTGSRGDTQPYVALGRALQSAGFQVRLAASESFADFVSSHGLEFFPVRGDVRQFTQTAAAAQALEADNPLKFFRSLQQPELMELMAGMQADFWAASQGADALLYHPGAASGYFMAQRLGIPGILASPFPMTPTRAYPSLIFYDKPRLGGWANWLTHKLFEQGFWLAVKRPFRTFWQQEFGQRPPRFRPPYSRRQLTIISNSNHVFPQPDDWPDQVHQTGYWFLDAPEDWSPPTELQAFLDDGDPPVYVGFGSIGNPNKQAETTNIVVQALRQTGQRAILASGWQGLGADVAQTDQFFKLDHAPHDWLFPRMAAVVHHGGAGTTAAALRAGVPMTIVPFGNDQFAWGQRVHELGVGTAPVAHKQLSVERLATALRATQQPQIISAARVMGERIRAEEGLQTAVSLVAAYLNAGVKTAVG